MTPRSIAECILLAAVVLSCWLGVLGMLRMREPMQSLHYIGIPATIGAFCMVLAVFLQERNTAASWKTLLIAAILFASNSVIAHATARAFRARQLGHWQPLDGDPFEFTRDTESPTPEHTS